MIGGIFNKVSDRALKLTAWGGLTLTAIMVAGMGGTAIGDKMIAKTLAAFALLRRRKENDLNP